MGRAGNAPKGIREKIDSLRENVFTRAVNFFWLVWPYIREHKRGVLTFAVVLASFVFSLPIYPMTQSQFYNLNISHTLDRRGDSTYYGIDIEKGCRFSPSAMPSFAISLDRSERSMFESEAKLKQINISFGSYNITFYGLIACDHIPDEDLNIDQTSTYPLSNSSIFGYFETCTPKRCDRVPFVLSTELEVISPDKSFKLGVTPYLIKTKTLERYDFNRYERINKNYFLVLTIKYPGKGPLLSILQRLKSLREILGEPSKVVDYYISERFSYE